MEAANRLGRRLVVVGTGPEERRLRALAGPTVEFLGWRDDRAGGRALRALPGAALPPRRGLRHHPARGDGGGPAGHRLGEGGALETVVPPGEAEPPTGLFFDAPDGGRSRRRHPALRGRRACTSSRRPCAGAPRRSTARSSRSASQRYLDGRAARGRRAMLKAYSRLLEQRHAGAATSCWSWRCWLLAYWRALLRGGPAAAAATIAAARPTTCSCSCPSCSCGALSFRAFDLYRPRRIGSHLSEVADIAKASSLGALVLVAVMTFFFREYDYSRVVIVYFWAALHRGGLVLPRRLPRGPPLRAAPRLQPALRGGGGRRRARRHA